MHPSVTVRLHPEDYKALTPDIHPVQLRYAALGTAVLGCVLGGGAATLVAWNVNEVWALPIWLAGALAGALVFVFVGARRLERGAAAPKDDVAPMTLTVAEAGLTVETEDFVARHVWRSFSAIDRTPDHVIIKTKRSGGFILPLRDFASPAHVEAFVGALRAGIARETKNAI